VGRIKGNRKGNYKINAKGKSEKKMKFSRKSFESDINQIKKGSILYFPF